MARGAPGAVLSCWRLASRRSARRGISLIARRRQDRPQRRHGMGDRGDGRVRPHLLIRRGYGLETPAITTAERTPSSQRHDWEAHGKQRGKKIPASRGARQVSELMARAEPGCWAPRLAVTTLKGAG